VTTAALLFIRHVEDQVTLGTVGEALFSQWLIYQRRGFIRLLGVTLSGQPEGRICPGLVAAGSRRYLPSFLSADLSASAARSADLPRHVRLSSAGYFTIGIVQLLEFQPHL